VGDPWLTAYPTHLLGIAAYIAGDYPAAREYYERSLMLRAQAGDREGTAIVLQLMVLVDLREGDLAAAEAGLLGALDAVRVMGRWAFAMWFGMYSHLVAARGDHLRAVEIGAAATAVRDREHTEFIPLMAQVLEEALGAAREALGRERYTAAWEAGAARPVEAIVAELVEPTVSAEPARAGAQTEGGPSPGLTPAETAVLRLLASGHTTREIATDLVVAVSTVERHITHVYQKLGVRNRAEATAWAVANELT
jgi:DNA-binding NarL/FixJ family response regulator